MATASMSVQDALWLTMDRPNNLMVVDGSMVLRGTPSIDDVRAVLEDAVERFPVLGRRAIKSGLGWAWEDDPDFDLDRHINLVELEPGMGIADLQQFMAEQRSIPLPKDRPMWTCFLLTPLTLADGTQGAAWMSRFHHAIADGVRLTQVMLGLCETEGVAAPAVVARTGVQSADAASGVEEVGRVAVHAAEEVAHVVEHGVGDVATEAAHAVRNPLSALAHLPGRAFGIAKAGVHGVEESLSLVKHPDRLLDALEVLGAESHRSLNDLSSVTKIALTTADETVWSGEPSTHKAVAWSEQVPLEDIKSLGRLARCHRQRCPAGRDLRWPAAVLGRAGRLTARGRVDGPGQPQAVRGQPAAGPRELLRAWCSCPCRWTSRTRSPGWSRCTSG